MSKNIRAISARQIRGGTLFQALTDATLESGNLTHEQLRIIAEQRLVSPATLLGTVSFYDFLKVNNSGKRAYVCNGTSCQLSGKHTAAHRTLSTRYTEKEIGQATCMGRCYRGGVYWEGNRTFNAEYGANTANSEGNGATDPIPYFSAVSHSLFKDEIGPLFVKQRTEGFNEFRRSALNIDLDNLENITGVSREQVREAAQIYGRAKNAMVFHGLGLTEHYQGSRGVMLVASLAMMTGNIGRPGVGVNPLRGQNNVQGAADMGVQPNLGAGYLDVSDASVRVQYEQYYGRSVPGDKGLTTPEMIHAAAGGKLKAIWIMGEDILQTDPNTTHIRGAIKNLDFW